MKRVLRAGFIAGMSLALAACSNFAFNQDKVQYESSASRAPLEIPPGMDSVPMSDRYAVPSRPQSVWASQEAQREAQALSRAHIPYISCHASLLRELKRAISSAYPSRSHGVSR